jgi:hypothetical protein
MKRKIKELFYNDDRVFSARPLGMLTKVARGSLINFTSIPFYKSSLRLPSKIVLSCFDKNNLFVDYTKN